MISPPRPRLALACASVAAILTLLPGASLHADEPVVWTNTVGVSTAGDALTKTGSNTAWDAGAASTNLIRDGSGYVEFTVSDSAPQIMVGLSNGDSGTNYDDVDYALHTSTGGL